MLVPAGKGMGRGGPTTLACRTVPCMQCRPQKLGRSGRSVKVQLPGRDLEIRWEPITVWIIGQPLWCLRGTTTGDGAVSVWYCLMGVVGVRRPVGSHRYLTAVGRFCTN